MNAIVSLQGANCPVTTSLLIAEGVGNQHKNVLELIRGNINDFNEFGRVAFETRNSTSGAGRPTEYAILNEPQSTLLLTYFRNTDVVKAFKKRLVKEFFEMRDALMSLPAQKAPAQPTRYQYTQREWDRRELDWRAHNLEWKQREVEWRKREMELQEFIDIYIPEIPVGIGPSPEPEPEMARISYQAAGMQKPTTPPQTTQTVGNESGYFAQTNETISALAKADLNGTQYAVLLAILHHSWLANRRAAKVTGEVLATWMGRHPRLISREITSLKQRAIIFKTAAGYELNSNTNDWITGDRSASARKRSAGSAPESQSARYKPDKPPV